MALKTPILLLVYNRIDFLHQIVSIISKVSPTSIYIVADGPKDNKNDVEACKQVRDYLDTAIEWKCNVHKLYRRKNMGCKRGVSEGINWFFRQVEEGIILEDDCLPDLSFFPYCEKLLLKYRNNNQIYSISGSTLHTSEKITEDSYYFTRFPNVWGWATWRRTWQQYDVNISSWKHKRHSTWLTQVTGSRIVSEYLWILFEKVYIGDIDTWDYQFTYLHLLHDAYSIIPESNLVTNLGVGNKATHTKNLRKYTVKTTSIKFPLKHPLKIVLNQYGETLNYRPILANPIGFISLLLKIHNHEH